MISATQHGFGAPSTSKVNVMRDLGAAGDVLDRVELGAQAQLRADRHRRREPHLVAAVVHAHRDAVDPHDLRA